MKTKRAIRFLLAAIFILFAASWGISLALHQGWGRRLLLARLSASFGRPVEARAFSFSLLGGPSLQADAVTVAEDPRFGNEYFLRADQLTAKLHWSALLRGHVEFGTISFSHPSLNVVREPSGQWNFESWLPPALVQPSSGSAQSPAATPPVQRLRQIVVDDGRINFKLGEEKILFALTDVSGQVDQDQAGRWNLDLVADPLRASVSLQDAGTLRLRGTVGGTSARLRPASLALSWENASLADALRLAGGQDYGIRGMIGAEMLAQLTDQQPPSGDSGAEPSQWQVSGKFHLASIHRWDLTARETDPVLNLIFSAAWQPRSMQISILNCLLETNHSQLEAKADANWSHGFAPDLQVSGSRISLEDVVAWTRAFRAYVPDGLSAAGTVDLRATARGWPLRIEDASISGTTAAIRLPGLGGPVHVGPLSASLHDGSMVLAPVSVSLPGAAEPARSRNAGTESATPATGALSIEASFGPMLKAQNPADWPYRLVVSGRTGRGQDLLALAQLLGQPVGKNLPGDWTVQGPIALQLSWLGTPRHPVPAPSGTLDLRGVQITGPLLNQPLLVSAAQVDFRPGKRHVTLAAARAVGALWNGSFDWDATDPTWRFNLTADRLDAADLDRWLGPRARGSFFARMFTGGNPSADRDAAIKRFAARGQVHIATLVLEPLELQKVDAVVEWKGRDLILRRAQADVFDGHVLGDFEARLTANPSYSFHGQFDRVNLAQVTSPDAMPEARVSGLASGDFEISAHGIGREALIASLSAQGDVRVRTPIFREPFLRDLDPASGSLAGNDSRSSAESRFRTADASIRLAAGVAHVDRLALAGRERDIEAQGSVDFAGRLKLRVWSLPRGAELVADSDQPVARPPADRQAWAVGGTLGEPLITRRSAVAGDVAASAPVLSPIPSTLPAPPFSAPSSRR